MNNFKLGIIIPTFNEKDAIRSLSIKLTNDLKTINYFICFVDDTNDDSTINEINKYFEKKIIKIVRGKKTSLSSSRCQASWIGFQWFIKNTDCNILIDLDADLAHDPNDIISGLEEFKINNCDLVIASKYKKGSKVTGRSFIRRILSLIYTKICQIVFTKDISDYSNSFRLYKREAISNLIKSKNKIYNSPVQHLDNLLFFYNNNYKIKEISSNYTERSKGESTIKFRDLIIYSFQFLKCIILNKLNIS